MTPPRQRLSSRGQSALGKFTDINTGWSFTGVNNRESGFMLTDISHDGLFMADSISIERIGLAAIDERARNPPNQANFQVISLPQMKCTVQPRVVDQSNVKPTDLPLGYYMPRLKVEAEYEYTGAVYEMDQKIRIQPRFVFTSLSKDPSHEPGGILRGARLHPMVHFELDEQTRAPPIDPYRRVTAIQVLFRLHIKVIEGNKIWNQAGVFYDLDPADTLAGVGIGLIPPKPGSLFFLRAEKPLPFEIVGKGVERGYPSDWDNIHQWASPLTPSSSINEAYRAINLVPTPGMPFGFHSHWRWSETAATGGITLPGGKQFAGPGGAGFPLIDPTLPDQTIEFAIIQPSFSAYIEEELLRKIDMDPIMWLFKHFDKIWSDIRYAPDVVLPSSDLVIWMSITAYHRPDYKLRRSRNPKQNKYELPKWQGTLFSHGLFFAHEDWDVLPRSLRVLPGIFSAQYLRGTPKQVWRRP
jgi:hypothetical protein